MQDAEEPVREAYEPLNKSAIDILPSQDPRPLNNSALYPSNYHHRNVGSRTPIISSKKEVEQAKSYHAYNPVTNKNSTYLNDFGRNNHLRDISPSQLYQQRNAEYLQIKKKNMGSGFNIINLH